MNKTKFYRWLLDGLGSIKAYRYFYIFHNSTKQGVVLISKAKRKRTIVSILRTSPRCYKLSLDYFNFSVPVILQEFHSFSTLDDLLKYIEKNILTIYKKTTNVVNITNSKEN